MINSCSSSVWKDCSLGFTVQHVGLVCAAFDCKSCAHSTGTRLRRQDGCRLNLEERNIYHFLNIVYHFWDSVFYFFFSLCSTAIYTATNKVSANLLVSSYGCGSVLCSNTPHLCTLLYVESCPNIIVGILWLLGMLYAYTWYCWHTVNKEVQYSSLISTELKEPCLEKKSL